MIKVLQEFTFDEEVDAKEISVSFGINCDGSSLDPDHVTTVLNVQPSSSWRKGDAYLSKTRNPKNGKIGEVVRPRYNTRWGIETKGVVKSNKVADHLSYIDQLLSPKLKEIQQIIEPDDVFARITITKESYDIDIYYDVDSSLLMRCCKLCKEITFVSLKCEKGT
ncbi:MAG TPA: hypothetical protein DEP23_08510 [Ruminococcaceae bacterium]|jgi:hypothetical protein|uniref:DUF4279 domain-containing protein n=1 Tax=Proteiniphilum sp. UBA5463 TaxID=1947281 RepID=UPI000EE62478|nr:DUF4279 domain-containing protein [Proteiniphilum sp. UBA5463]HCA29591.1 hypothetical protein [Oscillospiraceae bacterium]